jgi:hypothetical protein
MRPAHRNDGGQQKGGDEDFSDQVGGGCSAFFRARRRLSKIIRR